MNIRRQTFLAGLLAGLIGGIAAAFAAGFYGSGADHSAASAVRRSLRGDAPPLDKVARDIRNGGYILYFRHGNRQKWDSVIAFDIYEIATGVDGDKQSFRNAVCLTHQGVEEARMIGKILQLAQVPVKMVLASPSCRAQQTGRLAFGRVDRTSAALAHTPVTNPHNAQAFASELKRVLLSVPAGRGEVTVITAHGNTLENHPDMFTSGSELLNPLLQETGFYVIARDSENKLRIVQRFHNLGDFAARAIDLEAGASPQ
jgi:phosphohistidine phosphatase SixA